METVRSALQHMATLNNLNQWVYGAIKQHIGHRVLEAGCGNGNLTSFYLTKAQKVIALDNDGFLLNELEKRHQTTKLSIFHHDLNLSLNFLSPEKLDTIICLNTLEHIENDEKVLLNFHEILTPNGKLILQVPTLPWLYGSVDRAVGHYRRYSKDELKKLLEKSGFHSIQSHYFNVFGILGWFVNGKIMRKPYLSSALLSLFDNLLPAFSKLEKLMGPPIGLSLIAIAEK